MSGTVSEYVNKTSIDIHIRWKHPWAGDAPQTDLSVREDYCESLHGVPTVKEVKKRRSKV